MVRFKKINFARKFSHTQLLVFAIIFAAVGGFLLYKSFALNPNLPGDVNNDNTVNITDLSILLSNYNQNYPQADFNSDGTVNVIDMSILLSNYGKSYTGGVSTITMGETNILGGDDNGNGNLLIAQQATLSQTATITSMSFYVTTASGKLRLGIYDSTGPSGGPGVKKAETGEITPTSGWNTASVNSSVSLGAGTYWLAYLSSDNNLGFKSETSGQGRVYSYNYSAMPNAFSTSPNSTTAHWSLYATLTTSSGGGTPAPTVSLSANPTTITSGSSSTLTWNSTNATSCTATGACSGSKSTAGTQSVSPTSSSVYSLSCAGTGGTANASSTVTVTTGGGSTSSCPLPAYHDASCTGVPAGVTLHSCSTNITASGTYDACQFNGDLVISASNVKITRSLMLGPVRPSDNQTGLIISDSTINCQCLSTNDDDTPVAIMENNFTLLRVNIYNAGHGVSAKNNVTVQDSYIHGLGGNTQAHKNGIFVGDGSNQRFIHNNVECNDGSDRGCTAAIGIYDDFSDVFNVVIDSNLLNTNGAYCFYASGGPSKPYVSYNITFTNNHFGRKFEQNCAVLGPVTYWDSSKPGMVWSGNVWDDTGQAVPASY